MKNTTNTKSPALSRLRLPIVALLGVMLSIQGSNAFAERVNKKGETFPKVTIPKVTKGDEITTALGANLPAIASWYGATEAELKTHLKQGKSMRADKKGQLHYVCSSLALDPDQAGDGGGGNFAPFPDSQTFVLHSRPGSSKKIYLDFNGHTTIDTEWNINYTNGANIVTPPYDIDGVPGTFSPAELSNIQLIWQRVAEDYALFDVDVTTEDPGVEALQKTSPTDTAYGKRVCIGGSSMDWLGVSAGGMAYLGSFDWNTDTPVFVFPAQLGNGAPRYVGEAVSHESGHSFGLHHDGTTAGVEYYQGTTDWAPIMGVGYYSNIVQWSKGDYAGANNTEDDLAIIASYVPIRADSVGNTISTATALTGTYSSTPGLIESQTDVDVFSFTTGAGNISFNLTPASPSGNLFGQLTLYNAAGTPITSAIPISTTTGTVALSSTVAQGTYYIAVDGVGSGTVFNDYDSAGQYTLEASLIGAAASLPPVANAQNSTPLKGKAPLTVNFSSNGSYDPDGTITGYSWNFGDGSANSTAPNPSKVYTTPNNYTASLVVTDNTGVSGNNSVNIHVAAANAVAVYAISMTTTFASGKYTAKATVTVKDVSGNLKGNATVKGNWSGVVTKNGVTAKTGSNGTCVLTSTATATKGTFTFTVTGITLSSFVYDPVMNTVTAASITPP
jgi:PKD repeat protein